MPSPQPAPTDSVFQDYVERLARLNDKAQEMRGIVERRNDRLFGVDAESMTKDSPVRPAEGLGAGLTPLLADVENALNSLSETLFLLRHQIDRQSPLG